MNTAAKVRVRFAPSPTGQLHVGNARVAQLRNFASSSSTGSGFSGPRPSGRATFAVSTRPVKGTRGDYRVAMRHGVSRLITGQRHTLGIIFHDAA